MRSASSPKTTVPCGITISSAWAKVDAAVVTAAQRNTKAGFIVGAAVRLVCGIIRHADAVGRLGIPGRANRAPYRCDAAASRLVSRRQPTAGIRLATDHNRRPLETRSRRWAQ